jgi:hypothetical protein
LPGLVLRWLDQQFGSRAMSVAKSAVEFSNERGPIGTVGMDKVADRQKFKPPVTCLAITYACLRQPDFLPRLSLGKARSHP